VIRKRKYFLHTLPAAILGSLSAIQLTKSNSYIGIRIRTYIKSGRSSAPFNMGEQASERAGQARQRERPPVAEPGAFSVPDSLGAIDDSGTDQRGPQYQGRRREP
jgi:hypothetical protein